MKKIFQKKDRGRENRWYRSLLFGKQIRLNLSALPELSIEDMKWMPYLEMCDYYKITPNIICKENSGVD